MPTIPSRFVGTVLRPKKLVPQVTTVPSEVSARLREPEAAIATTLLRPLGTSSCPRSFDPQATTLPSALSAKLCEPPAATWNCALAEVVLAPSHHRAVLLQSQVMVSSCGN